MKTRFNQLLVAALSAIMCAGLLQAEPVVMGKDFVNSQGVTMDFRKKSDQGNAFWRSITKPLESMTAQDQTAACIKLTAQEKQAGNLPNGYAYFPNSGYDGRYVLMNAAELGLSDVPSAIPTAKVGLYKSPFAPNRVDVDLRNTNAYPSGCLVKCPFTGNIFRKP